MIETQYPPIGGMAAWCCSYEQDGITYGITLYATDPEQLIEDNCDALPGFEVHGRLVASYDFGDDDEAC